MIGFPENLDKYAELAVKVGVNIQKGQTLVINAALEGAELVRLVVKKAYEAGAKEVIVNWTDDAVGRLKYEYADVSVFQEFPRHYAEARIEQAENGAAFLSIVSSSPNLLKGINPEKIANFQKAQGKELAKFSEYILGDKVSWSIVAVPSQAWADIVFPEAPKEERINLLWEAIFKATRIDTENPVLAWQKHIESLDERMNYLNRKQYKKLHYLALGTDLTIEFPEKHVWCSAAHVNETGVKFIANMPTEEVFSMPLKTGVNGTVSNAKPLSYGGNIIDGFTLTFKDGRIVEVKADTGEEIMKDLIETDEGSHYLGEIALVPHRSPISESGILYYFTLFDENASNHLGIGSAYAGNLEGGKMMSLEELSAKGANQSLIHVDFMIGSRAMDIDGITEDGKREQVFRNGDWAF